MSFKFYNQREYEHVPYEYQGNGRNIKTSGCGICSACHPELLWSHRKMGDARGAQIAVISL